MGYLDKSTAAQGKDKPKKSTRDRPAYFFKKRGRTEDSTWFSPAEKLF